MTTNTALVARDARNRALRTFLIGLGIDVLVAVCLVLTVTFRDANGWSDLEGSILAFTLLKTVVQTAGSYVLRRFLDASALPTPLPPDPQGSPVDPVAEIPALDPHADLPEH